MTRQTPFKEIFNLDAAHWLADLLEPHVEGFDRAAFIGPLEAELPELELKARVERLAVGLEQQLPANFPDAARLLIQALPPDPGPPEGEAFGDFRFMPLARVVSRNGLEHFDEAMAALQALTRHFSVEFDIRYFLERYPERTLNTLKDWARSPDWRIRRLASEGTRPRLPWGLQLKRYVRDPSEVLELLEILRDEPHSAVRRSVANHLNDIAKDHPARVIQTLRRWQLSPRAHTASVTRHALRTLIKKGDPDALELIGVRPTAEIELLEFAIASQRVKAGETLEFSLTLRNPGSRAQRLVIDYAVHHQKANGSLAPKVFKLAERTMEAGSTLTLARRHSLRTVTTRTYYAGPHKLELLVNGQSLGIRDFVLETA